MSNGSFRARYGRSVEFTIAILFAVVIIAASGAALWFVFTMSVHSDPASVPSKAAGVPAARFSGPVEEARRLARELVVKENLPGLSVAVAQDGEMVWAEGFGWADVERKLPVTPLTRFRIGAASRPLAAVGAALLHDRGRLDLDAPVQQYVPAYPAKQWALTTRQLMSDVAGVHRLFPNGSERMPGRHCASLQEALSIFASEPLLFRPGTTHRYSLYGWILVSAVIEGAAKEPFFTFMQREVFAPLGMESTRLDESDTDPGLASFYFPRTAERTDLGLQDAPDADYSCWAGAGAFLSTPSDLVRLGSAAVKPGLLKPETIALFQTPPRLESGATTDYAMGWKVENVQLAGAPARLLAHRGSPMGGTAALLTFPERGLVVAVLSNVSAGKGVNPFGLAVADLFAKAAGKGERP